MKIMLTAFDAFGEDRINSSSEALDALFVPSETAALVKLKLPTAFGRAAGLLSEALKEHKPDAVLCIGQAAGRPAITVERVAINIMDAEIADNEGFKPTDVPIEANAPAAYFSTVPIKKIAGAVLAAGIPAEISNTAGTFVCNSLLYGALHYISVNSLPIRAGFIHVPCIPKQTKAAEKKPSVMELERIVKALEIAVGVTADCLK
ncbi:MAG: pyroglutamyl-peptidase I [Butyrivibrio sp.]|nr:pyroglutamyl-peptidase I [Butyrivibrio sp.]